jgi:uncharacterized membrane protein YhaH (DUF805 family)
MATNKEIEDYTKKAEQGDVFSQYCLGMIYAQENYDPEKALYWYTKAAEQGNGGAQYNLGRCYEDGTLENNPEKAVYWYTKAAEQGEVQAQYNLGSCYHNGEGVPKNLEKAVYWFTKAAEQGIAEAQKSLRVIREAKIYGGSYSESKIYKTVQENFIGANFIAVFKKWKDYKGRASRREFWLFALACFIVNIVFMVLTVIPLLGFLVGIVNFVFGLAIIIPSFTVAVRRLHDTNKTGWLMLLVLIPIVGWIILLVFYIQKGTPGGNKYGPEH